MFPMIRMFRDLISVRHHSRVQYNLVFSYLFDLTIFNKMNITHFLIYIPALLVTLSCNSFLEVEPRESISDEATITNGASAETAVRGMYRALAADNYYGTTFQSIGYLSGDNIEWTGSRAVAGQFVNHDVRADNESVGAVWSAIYTTINRANHIIEKVAVLPLEPA